MPCYRYGLSILRYHAILLVGEWEQEKTMLGSSQNGGKS